MKAASFDISIVGFQKDQDIRSQSCGHYASKPVERYQKPEGNQNILRMQLLRQCSIQKCNYSCNIYVISASGIPGRAYALLLRQLTNSELCAVVDTRLQNVEHLALNPRSHWNSLQSGASQRHTAICRYARAQNSSVVGKSTRSRRKLTTFLI
jgi:hypothetical protein